MRFRDLNIRGKLIVIQLITVVTVLILSSIGLVYSGTQSMKRTRISSLTSLAEVVAFNCAAPLEFMDERAAEEVLRSLEKEGSITHGALYNASGEFFAAYERSEAEAFSFSGPDMIPANSLDTEGSFWILRQDIESREEVVGTLLLRIGTDQFRSANEEFILMSLLVLLVSLGGATVAALFFQRTISEPIVKLVGVIKRIIETGRYVSKTSLDRKDELGLLSQEFDEMIQVIRTKEKELNSMNEILEGRVKDRTKELEEAYAELREKALELQRSNEELGELTYVISHDLQTPLRGITSIVGWLEEDLGPAATGETRKHLELLAGRAERVHRLLRALLAYSQINRHKGGRISVSPGPVIDSIVETLASRYPLKVKFPENLPDIIIDQDRLFQIFFTLLENAVIHNDKEEVEVEVTYEKVKEGHQFSITDNGPGIAREYHEKIFLMFQTLDRKDQSGNLGAGLPIAKKVIEAENGRIWIDESYQEGTRFLFVLPA